MGRRKGIIKVKPNSPEWEEARKNLIGASDVGSLFGVNVFRTRLLFLADRCGLDDGLDIGNVNTFRMKAGHHFEDAIAKLAYYHVPGLQTMLSDYGIRIHKEYPYISASLDRYGQYINSDNENKIEKYVLDCKNLGVNSYRAIANAAMPSKSYWLQIQQQLLVTQHTIKPTVGLLACWAGGQMLKVYTIKPCLITQAQIEKVCQVATNLINETNGEILAATNMHDIGEREERLTEIYKTLVYSSKVLFDDIDIFAKTQLEELMQNSTSVITKLE